jgi:diguanylate cyclase (GGDEF)-like protein
LATVIVEINEMTILNESYGHEVGDEAIQELAQLLLNNVNKDSIIARLGGGQFCIIYKNRAYAEIFQVFDELKNIIANNVFTYDGVEHKFTVSIAANIDLGLSIEHMIELADESLEYIKFNNLDTVKINS